MKKEKVIKMKGRGKSNFLKMKSQVLGIVFLAFSIVGICCLALMSPIKAAQTATVNVTVTAQNISVYAKTAAGGAPLIEYGNLAVGGRACSTTTTDTQEAINNGSITEDFNIKTTDSTDWDIGTSSPGNEIYTHQFSTTTGAYDWPFIDNEYVTMEEGIIVEATSTLDTYISVPSSTVNYGVQSTTITIQAVDGT